MHDFENFKQPLNVALLANSVTYQRSKRALEEVLKLEEARHSLNSGMIDVLFEKERPKCLEIHDLES